LGIEPESVLCRGQKISEDMKKIIISIAMVCLCAGSAKASIVPGAPTANGENGLIYTLYGPQQTPVGDPGTYSYDQYGTYSAYTLNLLNLGVGVAAMTGDVVVLENDLSTDKSNWSDFINFNLPDTYVTLVSYEGSDAAAFWHDYTVSDNVVYIQETGGPYTIYTATNDSGDSITYQITPQVHNVVVPEPTTMIAGALLLLPFGASTLRILRKSRAV
jgi:hypothetical protein